MSPLPSYHAILVVDDVNLVSRPMARMLAEAGYRVYEAGSGEEALEVLRTARRPIDLVITDVRMPEMNGVELMRRIAAEWPETKMLFMSAYPAEVLVQEGLAYPAMHFLAKPFTRADLLQKVQAAMGLERRRSERPWGVVPESEWNRPTDQ
ncbi:MAG TPA: response regulator [Gemmatimonadales bacterium]|nr:response regulator [Gemmatimonadales bacterium]